MQKLINAGAGILLLLALSVRVEAQAVSGGCNGPCLRQVGALCRPDNGVACTIGGFLDGLCAGGGCKPPRTLPTLTATMTGAEETPAPVTTTTSGTFSAKADCKGNWDWTMRVTDPINITMAHIHIGAFGVGGGVVVWLVDFRTSPVSAAGRPVTYAGTITPTHIVGKTMAELVQLFKAGMTYVNVHSLLNPSGVVRGQITFTP